jgi:hypothetical protein
MRLTRVYALTLLSTVAAAQAVVVRHKEGRVHGFLVLRDQSSRQIGSGEVTEEAQGDRVTLHTVYRFHDGSVDDETTVFSQRAAFQLISDHHLQQGPFFSKALDLTIDGSGQVTSRSIDHDGKPRVETMHMDLPSGVLVTGMVCSIMANLDQHTPGLKLPILSPTEKPRLIHEKITRDGSGSFSVAGVRHRATIFRMKAELGGVAGVVAPMIGKEPADELIWVVEGVAPELVRASGQLSEGGPVVSIEMAGASFPREAGR